MAFITAPDFRIASIDWVLRRPSQVHTSAWTGRRTVVANPWHGKWLARVQLAPLLGDNILPIRSFFARAKGSINTFRLYASEGPQNNNGGVTASATAAAGATSMTISGADVPMKAGQYVTANGQLLLLTADQSGATITFEPPLRAQVTSGATVVTNRPYALVYLVNSDAAWGVGPGTNYSVAFDVEEAILETDGSAPETASAPFNTVSPAVTGTPTQGQTLTVSDGTWTHSPTSYARQWLRNGSNIGGATGATYVLTAADVGNMISARVTATNAAGSASALSNSVGLVAGLVPPANTALPVITGAPYVFGVLTVSNGTWTGSPSSYTRQWQRNGTDIGGATGSTYSLTAADVGTNISAVVTATNAYGSTSATAASVGPIEDYELFLDFKNQVYRRAGTSYALASLPGYTSTRTGAVSFPNASGTVENFAANVPPIPTGVGLKSYNAATNLLLNAGSSSGLSTQSVTVTATAYTLSFIGTGTVTLSGVSTAGPLVGTGASNRVALTFTPTAGTLTLTVSGSVTFAGLIAGTFTDGGAIIATTGVTASIGASTLRVTDSVSSGDQLFWVVANVTAIVPGVTSYLASWDDGTNANYVLLRHNATDTLIDVAVASVTQLSQTNGSVLYGKQALVVLRSGGNWRAGKIVGGVLTWFGAATAGSFPALNRVNPGDAFGGNGGAGFHLNDHVIGQFRKTLTDTSDANILATVGTF